MNQHRYRIVFNRARGLLMAVAESASGFGHGSTPRVKTGNGSGAASPQPPLRRVAASAIAAIFGLHATLPAYAQIVADRNAPRTQQPTVLNAANGVPLVNIQTPSAAGVSRNTYSQFDVGTPGAILNNSRTDIQTQQGGWVQGNPWLAAGTAKVILNEVNSTNPSLLRGYVEVAGDRAQVVIANPAGISCDGCGFINANRVTLTTGIPVMNGGALESYRVQGGVVKIEGNGLDASRVDFTDLIARAVEINAGIWAKTLKVTTGANEVSADHAQATPTTGSGSAPAYGIDVGTLGGMYAGKIILVGTEAGVGVRNAGQIGASAGEVTVTADGRLENSGHLTASANVHIDTQGGIVNSGTVYAGGDARLDTRGDIDNTGTLAARGNTTLVASGAASRIDSQAGAILAAGLTADGSLAGSGSLQASATTDLSVRGQNLAGGDLVVEGTSIDLSGSQTSAGNVTLTARTGDVNASAATLQASQALNVTAQATVRTDSAQVSADRLTVAARDLSNVQGELVQTGTGATDIRATRSLDNTGGILASNGFVTLTSGNFINTVGSLLAGGPLSLTATTGGIVNTGGQIQALCDLTLTAGSATIDNGGGLIRSGGTTTLRAGSVLNTGTLGADLGIQGQSLAIYADQVDNRDGALLADRSLDIVGAGTVDNTRGLISSAQTLGIRDSQPGPRTLAITNTGGILIAGQLLNIDSARLTGDGQVLSQGDLSVKLTADYTHTGQFQANGAASLETAGTLTNQSSLLAGTSLMVKAATLDNLASGEISGTTTRLVVSGSLTNRGLIDGSDTFIDAATFTNIGSGRIYGDHVAIAATTLTNDAENGQAAVIAARDRLDIGATTLTNREHALIFSGGDLAIGGSLDGNHQANGQAGTVTNTSATIEALGNLNLSAQQVSNTNAHFSTQTVLVSQTAITQYQLPGSPNLWGPDQATVRPDPGERTVTLYTPEGISVDGKFYAYNYTRTVTEDQVLTSDPAQILAGGAMSLTAGTLLNDQSRIIAGGTLSGIIGTLTNTTATGVRTTSDNGTLTYYAWHHHGGSGRTEDVITSGYAPAPIVETLDLSPTVYAANTSPSGTGTQVAAHTQGSVGQSAAGAGQAQTSAIHSVAPNTTVPNNALFSTHPEAGSRYLVVTDPRFANYRTWLSSDYLLQQLSYDPTTTQKRLGDGFYEQRLVREQVAQLTGRRFLDGYASDEAQYRALLDAGATVATEWQLIPGVALTPAQMAKLTSDIVWLVEQEVVLPDGSRTRALVPQVYVRAQPGDLDGSGALLAGSSVNLQVTGDLINRGTIAGRDVVSLAAENLRNLGGRIAGNDVTLSAHTDLDNLGGRISAGNSLYLSAGRDLNVASTTHSSTSSQGERTNLDRVAGLYVTGSGGTLTAVAGRDAHFDGAEISNTGGGATTLAASDNLTLGTINESSRFGASFGPRNTIQESATADVGTRVTTTGDLTLLAGNDLTAKAIDVAAQGKVELIAGNDINILAGQRTQVVDQSIYRKTKSGGDLPGFGGDKTTTTIDQFHLKRNDVIQSSIAGENVTLSAGNDANLEAAKLTAQDKLAVAAGRDINIVSAERTESSRQMGSTTQAWGFGKKVKTETLETDSVTQVGSELKGQLVDLTAANNLTLMASRIESPGDVTLTAGNAINYLAATNLEERRESKTYKNNLLGFENLSGVLDNGWQKSKEKSESSTSSRTAAVTQIQSEGDVLSESGGDTRLQATKIQAGSFTARAGSIDGQVVNPDAQLLIEGVKESVTTSKTEKGGSFMWQHQAGEGGTEETLKLPDIQLGSAAPGSGPAAKASPTFEATGGIVVDAVALPPTKLEAARASGSQGGGSPGDSKPPNMTVVDLKAQAETLAQQPGLAWLGELAKRDDVDWKQIQLVHEKWDYSHSGLTQEGAIVIAIVVTILTWGAASSAGASLATEAGMTTTATAGTAGASSVAAAGAGVAGSGVAAGTVLTTTGAAVAAATAAGLSALASQAAVSLINNEGDIGKTLKDLGSSQNVKQLVASMLTAGVTAGLNLPNPATNTAFASRFATYATQAAVSAGVKSLVFGQPLSDTLQTGLVTALALSLTSEIGDWAKENKIDSGSAAKILAHAVVQCAAASLNRQDCGSAALGGAVAEALSPVADKSGQWGKAIASMGGMLAAALAGKDTQTALAAAQMVDTYNRQLHPSEQQKARTLYALAKQQGLPYTLADIEDAMRWADYRGESASANSRVNAATDAVVKGPAADIYASTAFDTMVPGQETNSTKGYIPAGMENGQLTLQQDMQGVAKPNGDLVSFIQNNTSGYSWQAGNMAQPPADPNAGMAWTSNGYVPITNGTGSDQKYASFSANGKTFNLPVVDCSAGGCTNGDSIAWATTNPNDQGTLEAYKTELAKQDAKAGVKAAVTTAAVALTPATLGGSMAAGGIIGGGSSATDQLIDTGTIDPAKTAIDTAVGAGVGAAGYGTVVAGGKILGAIGRETGAAAGTSAQKVTKVSNATPDLSAAEQAAAWQGSGLYPGVDRYRNITLNPDTYIVGATPGQSNYYTTLSGMRRTGMDVIQYYEGVQVAPNLTNPAYDVVRDGLTIYRVTDITPAAFGRALANPQYGKGGLPQVFVPDFSTLQPAGFIPFINKIPGIKP